MPEYRKYDDIRDLAHYGKHVEALSTECLHKTYEIAAELAHRDQQIEQLKEQRKKLVELASCFCAIPDELQAQE